MAVVANSWNGSHPQSDPAKLLTAKFKSFRVALRSWQSHLSNLKATIGNIKLVISFLDTIEERRDLSVEEWNFREILHSKLSSLLHQQQIYWRQRGAIKWVKLGDENSKLFHASATIRHRMNKIACLSDPSGEMVYDHNTKAALIWNDFKERLASTCFQEMNFDLEALLSSGNEIDLSSLELPFSHNEIDSVIKQLPCDKSPGTDGFSNEFMKKCWPIIKNYFYNICNVFHSGDVCLQSINGSYITLVPKVEGPSRINNYRPISLLHSSVKLVTKLLANR